MPSTEQPRVARSRAMARPMPLDVPLCDRLLDDM